MRKNLFPKQQPLKNFFPLPNQLYSIGLCAAEIAIYGFLVSLEDKQDFRCWPSYQTIADAVELCKNTVMKYVASLEDRALIRTEPSSILRKNGMKLNGNLIYTILPFQGAVDLYYERKLAQLEHSTAVQKASERATKASVNFLPPAASVGRSDAVGA